MERTATCSSCHKGIFPTDAFCSWCGTRVGMEPPDRDASPRTVISRTIPTGQRQRCRSCHSPVLDGDAFCAVCGARYDVPVESNAIREMWASILRTLEESTRGRFEFMREIGRGGMGTVYLARQLDLDRLVAIKVLSPAWLTNETMVERFKREARMIASIRHPSIVNVHGVGQTADVHYFVMDFIEGVSLSKVLRTHDRLSVGVTRAVLYQVGAALAFAHRPERGIVHRDIKPGNIMLDTDGNAIVTDFGIARTSDASSGLTMTGLIMGTPEYMSPEQCRGDEVTPASDQYSLGTVLYCMMAGSPPFAGTDYQVLIKQTTEPVPPLRQVRPDCPEELADAIMRMLDKDPGARWPSIMDGVRAAAARPLASDDPVRAELISLVRVANPVSAHAETVVAPQSLATPAGEDTKPTWLKIVSVPESLSTGDEIDLRATCILGDGTEHEGVRVEWESASPDIARVDPATGRLVAVGAGAAVITARAAGITESMTVTVHPPTAVGLELAPSHLDLVVGSRRTLTVRVLDARDREIDRPVQWSSSNPSVLTVSEDGTVEAVQPGSASVLALCDAAGAAATITVLSEQAAGPAEIEAPTGSGPGDTGPRTPPSGSWSVPGPSVVGGDYTRMQASAPPPHESMSWGGERASTGEHTEAPADVAADTGLATFGGSRRLWLAAIPLALVAAIGVIALGSGDEPADAAPTTVLSALLLSLPDSVALGDTVGLAALGVFATGDTAPVATVWESSDPAVLRVNGERLVASAPGISTIQASAGDRQARARMVVVDPNAEPEPGRLRIAASQSGVDLDPNGFQVVVDGQRRGSVAAGSELTVRGLEGGAHTVRLTGVASNCRVESGAERTVNVPAGQVATVEFAVGCSARPAAPPPQAPGTLQLRISPYGAVTVAGTAHGDRTRLAVELAAGSHPLVIARDGYQTISTTVTVRPGATVNLICTLGPQESSCRNP